MTLAIEQAMGSDIQSLDWMSPETKAKAEEKLHAVMNKIGYPDKWRDYSKLEIVRGEALGNQERVREFDFDRDMAKIGKPVDKGEWEMSPPTVNAYYDPQQNNVNFPAGYFQPPFFSDKEDDAANYGDMGSTIGHELTHGFDDEGRQFDKDGNLRDWWTKIDGQNFNQRAECMVKQYDAIEAVPGVHLNGKLTLGENLADLGGLWIAWLAYVDKAEAQHLDMTRKNGRLHARPAFLDSLCAAMVHTNAPRAAPHPGADRYPRARRIPRQHGAKRFAGFRQKLPLQKERQDGGGSAMPGLVARSECRQQAWRRSIVRQRCKTCKTPRKTVSYELVCLCPP